MRKLLLALVAVLTWCLPVFAQNVTNVSVIQEGNRIVVSYDIDKNSPEVGLTVSTDGGRTFSAPLTKVAGDVKNVQPGRRRIVWDVLAERDGLKGDNIVFNVVAVGGREIIKDYEWVDLGLSVKWATCNVGATSPEDFGDYFAWGETSPKSNYNWANLRYCTEGDSLDNVKFSKYVASSTFGPIDNKTKLDLSDDAARANWGGSWRMPTLNEFHELMEKCTWTWATINGKNGYKVESKTNGNFIFIPAAGWRSGTFLNGRNFNGRYWSSSLTETRSCNACYYFFLEKLRRRGSIYRRTGLPVRPVCP